MPQLPFVVAPKRETRMISAVVNGDTCSLEFPVFGSLLAGEEIAIRDADYQAAVFRESSRFADVLVADGMSEIVAQRIAIRCLSSRMGIPVLLEASEQRLMLTHASLVAEIQTTLTAEFQQQIRRTVTAVIAHRLTGCQSWTETDTDTIPQPLQEAIAAFADAERNTNQPKRTPEEMIDTMVETLGKLGPETGHSPPTGVPSSGDAESSGQLSLSSDLSDSPASPSPTSSKRSKKANAAS